MIQDLNYEEQRRKKVKAEQQLVKEALPLHCRIGIERSWPVLFLPE